MKNTAYVMICLLALAGCTHQSSQNPAQQQPSVASSAQGTSNAAVPTGSADTAQVPSALVGPDRSDVVTQDPSPATAIEAYQQQLGQQRRIVAEEKAALDQAIESRNNSVDISKDLFNNLAYAISTGVISWDFYKHTSDYQRLKGYFNFRKIPGLAPREGTAGASEATQVLERASSSTKPMLKSIGLAAYRTTELVSAAVLGITMFGDIVKTSKDIHIRFSDTNEIREHRTKLAQAEKNLEVAEQNLKVATSAIQ